jgi:hypothetical protein
MMELVNTGRTGVKVPDEHRRDYLVDCAIAMIDDVIDCLNLVIADMEGLPEQGSAWPGMVSKRYELLVRTFHGEAFRGREVLLTVAKEMVRRGYLPKGTQRAIRTALDEHLKGGFDVRHDLVHRDMEFVGPEITALRVFERKPAQFELVEEGTGKPVEHSLFARPLCEPEAVRMRERGKLYRAIYGAMIAFLAGDVPAADST